MLPEKSFRTSRTQDLLFSLHFRTTDLRNGLKPWGVRKTPTKAYLPQVQAQLGAIPGIQMFPIMPSALPEG
jgi:hypothetical protein